MRAIMSVVVGLLGTALLLGAGAAQAQATLVVNTTSDAVDAGDGLCSLREAIVAANTDTASGGVAGECPAGDGADTITFAVTGSITVGPVEPALPAITQSVSILGPGAAQLQIYRPTTGYGLSFSGPGQVFEVSGLSVTGLGAPSGGVSAGAGAITIDSVRLWSNLGSGGLVVSNMATVTVTNSLIDGNTASAGGGLNNTFGRVLVVNSVISDNGVGFNGGGVYNLGHLEIVGSLVALNEIGGGMGDSIGGGIYSSSSAVLTMTNSTLSGNLADDPNGSGFGGGLFTSGTTTLNNVTITGNTADGAGAGLRVGGGTTTLRNSLIANSLLQADCSVGSGTLTPDGPNLIEDNTCAFTGGLDPALGPLQDNGGPTPTHALMAGSPAIDAGAAAGCTDSLGAALSLDQRGFFRPVDGDGDSSARCDLGAVEYGSPGPPLYVFLPLLRR
jgi:CSLREA domain-containing protein